VVFGSKNKLTADGPFLDLLRAFQRELLKAQTLTIVGYSFADVHINICISQWLNLNAANRLRIVDPSFVQKANDYISQLNYYAPSRIELIKEPAGRALHSLVKSKEVCAYP